MILLVEKCLNFILLGSAINKNFMYKKFNHRQLIDNFVILKFDNLLNN